MTTKNKSKQESFSVSGDSAVLLPMLAAVGAIAALIGECTISIQRAEGQ